MLKTALPILTGLFLSACGLPLLAASPVQVFRSGEQPGHYLQWNGRPIILIGDSVTQGWMECGANFDQKAYVDALAARGLNCLMLWTYIGTDAAARRDDPRIGYDSPEIWPWAGSADERDFDLARFNTDYFDRLKELVSYAHSRGIVVLLTVHDGWTKTRFEGHPLNAALGNGPLTDHRQYVELADFDHEMPARFSPNWNRQQKNQFFQERFCDKLIAELEPCSNVIYEMFNEGEWYDRTQRRLHEQHFLAFFRARTRKLLLTNTDHITGDDPHGDAKVDVVTLHGHWDGQFAKFQDAFDAVPPKPCLQSEPVPSFDGLATTEVTLDRVRRTLWEQTIAGAGWVNQNDTSFGFDPKTKMAAEAPDRDAAYDTAGHCARFWNQSGIEFWNLRPQANLSSTGVTTARLGVEYVVYAPLGGDFTIDLRAAAGRILRVTWYDPRTGRQQSQGSVPGGSITRFSAPTPEDWVLRCVANAHASFFVPSPLLDTHHAQP